MCNRDGVTSKLVTINTTTISKKRLIRAKFTLSLKIGHKLL